MTVARRPRPHPLAPAAAVVLALLTGCSGADARSEDSPPVRPRPTLQRLLPGPASAGVPWQIESAWHAAPLPADRPESVVPPLRVDSFAGRGDVAATGWLTHAAFAPIVDSHATDVVLARHVDGALELPEHASVAALVLAASPLTSYVMTVDLRRPAGADAEARFYVIDLTEDLSAQRDPVALVERVNAAGVSEDARVVVAAPHVANQPGRPTVLAAQVTPNAVGGERWRVEFSSLWRTRSLVFVAVGSAVGDGRVALDEWSLYELPARAIVGLPAGSASLIDLPNASESLDRERRITKVRCDWETRRALLLPRGAKARCPVAPPMRSANGRVDFGLAIVREERLCVRGVHRERVRVTLGGSAQEIELSLAFDTPSCWHPLSLPLPAAGAGDGTLLIEVLGEDDARGPLVAVSDPLVWDGDPVAPIADDGPPNIVLISLDTLRADRLGRRHAGRSITPRLDALAARSVVFDCALSNASYTLPSHVSMFTSQRPGEHGVITVFDRFAPDRSPALARMLAQAGYVTAAFTSGGMLNAEFAGIDGGFDRYGEIDVMLTPEDRLREIAPLQARQGYNLELARRNRIERGVVPWLAAHRGAPFFLFVHSYLIHNYQPEPALARAFTAGCPPTPLSITGPLPYREKITSKWLDDCGHAERRFDFAGPGPHEFTPERDLPWVEALYDATVAQADREVGRILDALDQLDLTRKTIVVITADHGEEMFEHGNLSHARTLFDEILRVPLIVAVPGQPPRRVAEPVESIDLAPTLLARAGVARDPRMRGDDLLAEDWEARSVTIHEGIQADSLKLKGEPATLRAARAPGGKLIIVSPHARQPVAVLDDGARAQLEALGYLHGDTVIDGQALPYWISTGFFDLARDPGERADLLQQAELEPRLSARLAELFRQLENAEQR